jgi:hypothetical protein
VRGMAPRRRPRGTLVDPINLGYEVERSAKTAFDDLAERCGVSSSVLFERVVEQIPLDTNGLPTWWPEQTNEELPINSA